MREPKLIRVCEVEADQIEIAHRLRPLSEPAVECLIASVTELGILKDEVLVRQMPKGRLRLIAGLHRTETCQRMGRPVPVKIFDCTEEWARLMEIDDNLAGAEMTALDTAVFLARRKALYEQLHPESAQKTGAALAAARWNAADIVSVASFAAATAEKFGITERHVRRMVAIGTRLGPDEVAKLRGAPRPVQLVDLQALAKIGETAERYSVVDALVKGEARNAAAARKAYAARVTGVTAPVEDPVEKAFKRLLEAWSRAPEAAKRRFVSENEAALASRLQDARGQRAINAKLGRDPRDEAGLRIIAEATGADPARMGLGQAKGAA